MVIIKKKRFQGATQKACRFGFFVLTFFLFSERRNFAVIIVIFRIRKQSSCIGRLIIV
jgi:hypothetical protein